MGRLPASGDQVKLNPYQPGVSAANGGGEGPWVGTVEKICLAPLVVLVVTTLHHYSLIENLQRYQNRILIGVEFVSLLIAVMCGILHFARFTSFCYLGKFRLAFASLLACVITVAVIVWAIWYDSPTFLYAT